MKQQRGSATIEVAIVWPLVLILLCVMMDWMYLQYQRNLVNQSMDKWTSLVAHVMEHAPQVLDQPLDHHTLNVLNHSSLEMKMIDQYFISVKSDAFRQSAKTYFLDEMPFLSKDLEVTCTAKKTPFGIGVTLGLSGQMRSPFAKIYRLFGLKRPAFTRHVDRHYGTDRDQVAWVKLGQSLLQVLLSQK